MINMKLLNTIINVYNTHYICPIYLAILLKICIIYDLSFIYNMVLCIIVYKIIFFNIFLLGFISNIFISNFSNRYIIKFIKKCYLISVYMNYVSAIIYLGNYYFYKKKI